MMTFLVGPEIKDLFFSSSFFFLEHFDVSVMHGREHIIRLSPTLERYRQHSLSTVSNECYVCLKILMT